MRVSPVPVLARLLNYISKSTYFYWRKMMDVDKTHQMIDTPYTGGQQCSGCDACTCHGFGSFLLSQECVPLGRLSVSSGRA